MSQHHYSSAIDIDFIELRDGTQPELSAAEKQAAATAFTVLTDDLFLANLEHSTHTPEGIINNPGAQDALTMSINYEDGSSLSLYVISADTVDSQSPPRTFEIQEFDHQGVGWRIHRYELAADRSEVIRVDSNESNEMARIRRAVYEDLPLDPVEAIAKIKREVAESQANDQLERDFRLNYQPVGPDEIEKIADLAMMAKIDNPDEA